MLDWQNPTLLQTLAVETEDHGDKDHSKEGHHNYGHAMLVYVGITLAIIAIFIGWARRRWGVKPPTDFITKCVEHSYLFIERLALTIIGSHGRQYVTFLMTLWAFIFISNVVGLFAPYAATGDLGINLALAIVTWVYVHAAGIRQNGFFGHVKHFAGPKMTGALVLISGLLFVVEIVSDFARIGSLTLRLFANIEGGHLVVKNLDAVPSALAGAKWGPLSLKDAPIGGFLLPIKLLTAIVQAFIWVMLTSVYISLVTHEPHDDHSHDEAHEGPDGHGQMAHAGSAGKA